MNAYLAEVLKKQEEAVKRKQARYFALNLLEMGKLTLEEIADLTGLTLTEVTKLSRMLEGLIE